MYNSQFIYNTNNMSNLKKYNLFIFITSFAKSLVELFIPLILYDKGFSIKAIIFFSMLKYLFCSLFIPLTVKLGNKLKFTFLMIISSVTFSITYIYLNFIKESIFSLFILAFILSIYLDFYWVSRHIFGLTIIKDKKATDNVSLYSIFSLLGTIPATYVGAFVLEHFGFIVLNVIVFILMFLSVIPLIKMNNVSFKTETKVKKIIKTFPKQNYIFLVLNQFLYIITSLIPLYTYLYIKKEFNYIGLINIISGLGSVIYIYILSKKMDKNKKDYLTISMILLSIIYLFKISIKKSTIFLFITFFEGIMRSTLDTIILRNTYVYGKNYSVVTYIGFIEFLNNIIRFIYLFIFYLFNFNLKIILFISIIGLFINSFFKFDDGKYGYKKES